MEEPRVQLRHVRQMRWCASGTRAWCQQHGIDWLVLVHEGIPCATVEATGDHFAQLVAALAREEAANEQR